MICLRCNHYIHPDSEMEKQQGSANCQCSCHPWSKQLGWEELNGTEGNVSERELAIAKVSGDNCRECGEDIFIGYSYLGLCVVCAEPELNIDYVEEPNGTEDNLTEAERASV